jgi:hypothetical protein
MVVLQISSHTKFYGKLIFEPLDPFVPCGDGSPAGIYREDSLLDLNDGNKSLVALGENHIIVFLGGGFCMSDQDCFENLKKEPYKLSLK